MYYQKGTTWYLCTGSLISEENHFLSNEHCVNSQAIVDTLQVRFNYQYTTCDGSTLAAYDTYYGDAFLVSHYNYDCSLMTLSGDPQATYGYLDLDPRDMVLNERDQWSTIVTLSTIPLLTAEQRIAILATKLIPKGEVPVRLYSP
jgi:hypothetical protein